MGGQAPILPVSLKNVEARDGRLRVLDLYYPEYILLAG
jgi:hypothetical protein